MERPVLNNTIIALLSFIMYYLLIYIYHYFGALYAKIIVLLFVIGVYAVEIYFRKNKFVFRFLIKAKDYGKD